MGRHGPGFPGPQGARAAAGRGNRADPRALGRGAGRLRGRLLPHPGGDDLRPPRAAGPDHVAASGPLAAKLAGRVGDGFICTSGKGPALYDELLAKGARAPRRPGATRAIGQMIEIKVSYDRDPKLALDQHHPWAALALKPEQKSGIHDPIEMERVADQNLDRRPAASSSSDPEEVVERIAHLRRARVRRTAAARPRPRPVALPRPVQRRRIPLLRDRLA